MSAVTPHHIGDFLNAPGPILQIEGKLGPLLANAGQ